MLKVAWAISAPASAPTGVRGNTPTLVLVLPRHYHPSPKRQEAWVAHAATSPINMTVFPFAWDTSVLKKTVVSPRLLAMPMVSFVAFALMVRVATPTGTAR